MFQSLVCVSVLVASFVVVRMGRDMPVLALPNSVFQQRTTIVEMV